MAYDYPYDPTVVQDDVDFVLAEHQNKQGSQLKELTDAVKALDDFKDLFPPIVGGDAGKALVVNGTEDGYEHAAAGGGLLEPGLIQYNEPDALEEGSYGFEAFDPAALVTNRALTIDEDIRLRVQEMNGGPPSVIGQPATIAATYLMVDSYVTEYFFTLTGSIVTPLWISFPPYIVARLGVFNTALSAWVDFITVFVIGGWGPL